MTNEQFEKAVEFRNKIEHLESHFLTLGMDDGFLVLSAYIDSKVYNAMKLEYSALIKKSLTSLKQQLAEL